MNKNTCTVLNIIYLSITNLFIAVIYTRAAFFSQPC